MFQKQISKNFGLNKPKTQFWKMKFQKFLKSIFGLFKPKFFEKFFETSSIVEIFSNLFLSQ